MKYGYSMNAGSSSFQGSCLRLEVVKLAELLRVHAQLARHLHLGVREVMALAHVDPDLKPLGIRLPDMAHRGFYVDRSSARNA